MDRDDLACIFVQPDAATIAVGTLHNDSQVPARLITDELFSKHFIVVGTTGCGKSSALICILQQVLESHAHAHIVVLDIHSEYQTAFGDRAELVNPGNLHLPFWLLNFQELCEALTTHDSHHDSEVEILADAIVAAKRRYSDAMWGRVRRFQDPAGLTADTPTPFRLSDVVAHLEEQVGRLERMHATLPYRRLKNRIETLATDARYSFMFGNPSVEDTMADILGRLFRVPSEGRPLTVIDLAAVPAEILDVVVSLLSRLAFDLAVWSDGKLPLLLVCEEAHRYAPSESSDRFLPTRQALARIAKEGRKYGISLALVTQRPSDLDTTILSQCSTVIAMRLSTERDQKVVRANAHDSAFDLLDYLPLLADREAIVLGQGVVMPMRIRFQDVVTSPTSSHRQDGFASRWKKPNMDRAGLEQAITRWRLSGRNR
jgi:DNA helicase HerA-like ATPase